MAKKFGKFTMLGILAGVAAGTYYYFYRKKKNSPEDSEDLDDYDDFDEDLENEDFAADPANQAASRHIVPLDLDNAKEKIGEKVIETLDKTKEKIEQFNMSEKIDKAKEIIGEMTAPAAAEPTYTQMDMSAVPADAADTAAPEEKASSVSSTYADDAASDSSTEDFFDDSALN